MSSSCATVLMVFLYGETIFNLCGIRNIWNVLDDVSDPKANFNNFEALKDIGLGAGFGLRYDFDFFILRLDTGFKAYNPSYELNKRWLKDFNFNNAVYNIGINYPF